MCGVCNLMRGKEVAVISLSREERYEEEEWWDMMKAIAEMDCFDVIDMAMRTHTLL